MTPLKEINALLDNEQGSASGLAHYYTSIVSNSINEYHDFGTIAGTIIWQPLP
jgi:2-haloacid dehalogenase